MRDASSVKERNTQCIQSENDVIQDAPALKLSHHAAPRTQCDQGPADCTVDGAAVAD